jgi:hypothetical protein
MKEDIQDLTDEDLYIIWRQLSPDEKLEFYKEIQKGREI